MLHCAILLAVPMPSRYKEAMLQRSKPQRSSRRGGAPAKAAADALSAPDESRVAQADATPVAEAPTDPVVAADGARVTGSPAALAPSTSVPVAMAATPAVVTGDVAAETPAGPGIAPVVETAPTGPAPVGETNPAPAPSAALPVPPATRARFVSGNTLMEKPMQQANKAAETMMKAAEEAAEFGRGNVEAITKATQIYFTGVQDLGKQTFAVVQGLTDHAIEGAKALSGVKSLQEAVQIQSNYARAALEKSVSESAKLGETALKLTEQAFAPITARMTLAAEKITKVPAAA